MFAKEAEASAFAEPLVPKRYHTWLRILTQWKNEKDRNSDPDHWVKYFCPYFTTEGLLRQAWDDARRVGGGDGRKLVKIVTAWQVEGQYLVWSAEVETPMGLATGHSTSNLGDGAKGVDTRNPFENGETSAIGRALRHLGYGFGFETDDEASAPEDKNGHADHAPALPGNCNSAGGTVSGYGAKPNGNSSNGTAGSGSGSPAQTRTQAEAAKPASSGSNGQAAAGDFNQLRNEVLSLSRRLSATSKREITEVVSWASDGTFQYSDIGKLTSADLPKLRGALQRLKGPASEPATAKH